MELVTHRFSFTSVFTQRSAVILLVGLKTTGRLIAIPAKFGPKFGPKDPMLKFTNKTQLRRNHFDYPIITA